MFDAATFEKRLVGLSPGERVAVVKRLAEQIAARHGWIKDSRISEINKRAVYRDPTSKKLYAVDTQHGRFEVSHLKSGKHQGEIDLALKPTMVADRSGSHDLRVK